MVSSHGRREQVNLACERGLSQRRACGLICVSRSSLSYELRLPPKDAPVMAGLRRHLNLDSTHPVLRIEAVGEVLL